MPGGSVWDPVRSPPGGGKSFAPSGDWARCYNSGVRLSTAKDFPRRIFYSARDKCWIGVAEGAQGCSAFGNSPAEALRELEVALGLWLEVKRDDSKLRQRRRSAAP